MVVEHKGFLAVQAYNNHIHVFDDNGNKVLHATCFVEMSEDELRDFVEGHFFSEETKISGTY